MTRFIESLWGRDNYLEKLQQERDELKEQLFDLGEQIKNLKNIITDQQGEIIKYQNNQALPGIKDPQNRTILTTPEQVQQTMNRLWDLYETHCQRLQRLQPEF